MPEIDDQLVLALGRRFIERKDVKSFQLPTGAYTPTREPVKIGDLRAHLAGTHTMGHYMVSPEGNCKLFAFDIDLDKPTKPVGSTPGRKCYWSDDADIEHEFNPREAWLDPSHPARPELAMQLRCLAEGLALRAKRLLDIPVAVTYSGCKGVHVYGFTGTVPAAEAREAARYILESFNCFDAVRGEHFFKHRHGEYPNLTIELFPKQDDLAGKELGNLMKLPLGVDRRTKQTGYFVDLTKPYDTLEADDPMLALELGSIR